MCGIISSPECNQSIEYCSMRYRDRVFALLPQEITFENQRIANFFYRACPVLMRHAVRAEKTRNPQRWNLVTLFGIDVPPEWLPDLFLSLRKMERLAAKQSNPPWILQVKMKFSSLRIYYRYFGERKVDPEMEAIILETNRRLVSKGLAEVESVSTRVKKWDAELQRIPDFDYVSFFHKWCEENRSEFLTKLIFHRNRGGLRLQFEGITPDLRLEISRASISTWAFQKNRRMGWLGSLDFPWDTDHDETGWFCGICRKNGKGKHSYDSREALAVEHTIRLFVDSSNALFADRERTWLVYYGYQTPGDGGFVRKIVFESIEDADRARQAENFHHMIRLDDLSST